MKYAVLLCDGMADLPIAALGGKTPFEAASTPAMDRIALHGIQGMIQTVPEGFYPGSETAILSILGYRPEELPQGRGPLEARGLDIPLLPGQYAGRYLFNKTEKLTDNECCEAELETRYPGFRFFPIDKSKGICVAPPDSCGLPECDSEITFWSADGRRDYEPLPRSMADIFGYIPRACVIAAVPLLRGIALETGMDFIRPEGATGDCDTDYRAKGECAVRALLTYDFLVVHIEACDAASHRRDVAAKIKAIEEIDRHIVAQLSDALAACGEHYSLLILPDHLSLCSKGCHAPGPVPYILIEK